MAPRTFPILIGIFEATSIDRRVKGYRVAPAADARFDRERRRNRWAASFRTW